MRCFGPAATIAPVLVALCAPTDLIAADATICDIAAQGAAARTGVPLAVLRAISRVETGRNIEGRLQPWPWTVNMEGEGRWFASRTELLDYVEGRMRRGARSFDLGCFQINYRWHGQAFRSVADMTDPLIGARYAARFLADLHDETGNWIEAAGAYHSRTPVHARRYKARFEEVLGGLDAAPLSAMNADPPVQALRADRSGRSIRLFDNGGAPGSAGSLVPAGLDAARPLFASGG